MHLPRCHAISSTCAGQPLHVPGQLSTCARVSRHMCQDSCPHVPGQPPCMCQVSRLHMPGQPPTCQSAPTCARSVVCMSRSAAHLAVDCWWRCVAADGEQRHHPAVDVIGEVAVEQPGAGVVSDGVHDNHGTGLHHHLTHRKTAQPRPGTGALSSRNARASRQPTHCSTPVTGSIMLQTCKTHQHRPWHVIPETAVIQEKAGHPSAQVAAF